MSELKELHPYLYKRVRLKGIVFSLLGLSSIFSGPLDRLVHSTRIANGAGIDPTITGIIFLAIGLYILITLYGKGKSYLHSRWGLYAALVYALFWEFVLLLLAIKQSLTTVSIFILWGYLTYNLLIITRDTAWEGAELVRELREED